MKTTVSIVEDHETMRLSLSTLISSLGYLCVLDQHCAAEEALVCLEEGRLPDVLLVDLSLPGMNGMELIGQVKQRWPGTRCLVLSGQTDNSYIDRSRQAGADGFVLKGDPEDLIAALQAVTKGQQFTSPVIESMKR